jgi:deazaflavin-dependent oxidoreductase (nitroreductase family)
MNERLGAIRSGVGDEPQKDGTISASHATASAVTPQGPETLSEGRQKRGNPQHRQRRNPVSELHPSRARSDPRERVAREFFGVVNPLVLRLMSAGIPTGSRNILVTVLGRRSGKPRTTPISMLELDGRMFVRASYSESGWVRNIRAAGEATKTDHGRHVPVRVVEIPPDEAAPILRRALEPYRRA